MSAIRDNLKAINERIAAAAERSGRSREDITLIAVTKLHEPSEIDEAIECGVTDIAENKVQEVLKKYNLVRGNANWHLIGHLQTNKVRQIVGRVCLIHSVDSLHLAAEIDKRSSMIGRVSDVLVQVNAAGEEQKSGVSLSQAGPLVRDILDSCPNVRIRGLMGMAPYAEDPEDVRIYFRQLRELFEKLAAETDHPMADFRYLSMGMSGDFEVAIEEGSNMVRIGTAIFGARDYSKTI